MTQDEAATRRGADGRADGVAGAAGRVAILADRRVIAVGGADAVGFLQSLVTCEVAALPPGTAAFGALLSPQGKILFDFLATRTVDGFLLDVAEASAAALTQRLRFYRLRAKVTVEPADMAVATAWGGPPPSIDGVVAVADPRLAALGYRLYGAAAALAADATAEDYHRHRIALGVPEGGRDFAFGDCFPHEADMDVLAGVDFGKGCYVGQEVVSRMQHRGTARRRMIVVEAAALLPPAATPILAAGRAAGSMGSSDGGRGLALVRLDRVRAALDAGGDVTAADVALTPAIPPWATFGWPAAAEENA